MKPEVLDNPIWHALSSAHAGLAIAAGSAARYPAEVAPFAGVASTDASAAEQLGGLIGPGESLFLLGVAPPMPAGWQVAPQAAVLQMVCKARPALRPGPQVTVLGAAHRDDMLELTALVFPGFFRSRTLEMGRYIGIYIDGRLAAMAGERMRMDGYQEISAVCTHPAHLGRGHAHQLVAQLCNESLDRGFTPFLHVYPENMRARAIYERVGFADRTTLQLWPVTRAAPVLRTGRLALRELTASDGGFILRLLNDPDWLRFIGDRGVRDLESARAYIANGPVASYAQHGFGLWLVELAATGAPIGLCGLLKRDSLPDADIGFAFLPDYRSQGYACEAAGAVLQHGRGKLGFKRIVAIVSPDNAGSIRLLVKLGMRRERQVRMPGNDYDIDLYALEGAGVTGNAQEHAGRNHN